MKIVTIIGARPQFIKAALVSQQIRHCHDEVVIHTGQHYDAELSDVFFREMAIPEPRYNLGVGSDTHAQQTAKMMVGIEGILTNEAPDMVLVYGDTNSTLAGALAASKLGTPIGHIEAGPRMFDKSVPEEINRVITDHISALLFAPTQASVENLRAEGITTGVHLPGDVMMDSLNWFSRDGINRSTILGQLGLPSKGYVLATVHRARNTDGRGNLQSIVGALVSTNERVVFPAHPRTMKCLRQHGLYEQLSDAGNVSMIRPVGYLDMLMLLQHAKKVVTDSGGIQKEAYIMRVPCITLDRSTGWVETVEDGWNTLVSSDTAKIVEAIRSFEGNGRQRPIFGAGDASKRIVEILGEYESLHVRT